MKKQFYTLLALLLTTLSSMALNVGDYVYTWTGRCKVVSQNLVVNPSFEAVDPTAADFGWNGGGENYISSDVWAIAEEGHAIESLSSGTPSLLMQNIAVESGKTYLISMKVKSAQTVSCVPFEGSLNRISVSYKAGGAADSTVISTNEAMPEGEWTTLQWEIKNVAEDGVISIIFSQLYEGTQITDIELVRASVVFDDRIYQRKLAYINAILASGEMPEGVEEFQELLAEYDEMAKDPETADDNNTMEGMMSDIDSEFNNYMLLNSADYMGNISKGLFSSWGKQQKPATVGDWVLEGGRWFSNNGENLCRYEFPGNFELNPANAHIVKDGVTPGRYMFAVDAMAIGYSTSKINEGYYNNDFTVSTVNDPEGQHAYLFCGADSIAENRKNIEPYSSRFYQTYFIFGNVGEDGHLDIGIHFPGFTHAKGGVFRLQDARLRLVGLSQTALDRAEYVKRIIAQQNALRDFFPIYQALIDSTGYVWGKQALRDTMDVYRPLYEESLAYVDADGKDLDNDAMPEDYDTILKGYVSAMSKTRSTFFALNRPYTNLVDYIVVAQATLDDEAYAKATAATRTALTDCLASSRALIDATTEADTANAANYTAKLQELKDTEYAFKESCASFENPADVVIVNPTFADGWNGWQTELESGSGMMKNNQAVAEFNTGKGATVWRGNTAFPKNAMWQEITLKKAGVYRFSAQAFAYNENTSSQNAMWNGLSGEDSIRNSGIRMWFGKQYTENASDSVIVCTNINERDRTYELVYTKDTDAEEIFEFGLDARHNGEPAGKGCNTYGFGNCRLVFMGAKDAYETGINNAAAVIEPKSALYTYTLSGVRVNGAALTKGVYVRGGRKFVVK